jgi:hypothetical protein
MIRQRHLPLLLALVAIPVAACSMSWNDDDDAQGVAPQGSGGERTYAVRDFDRVSLGAGGDVEVRVGSGYSVTATGSPDALDKILVERDGSALKLTRKRGINWGNSGKVRFLVTMPRIVGADIGGSGSILIDRAEGDRFTGNIGGSGQLDVRGLAVDKAEFSIGGSGDVAAQGTAKAVEVSIGGSGRVRAQPLRAETGEITIAGAGNVAATITRSAEVTIMGSGNVAVTGGAKCKVTKMGAGKVDCG